MSDLSATGRIPLIAIFLCLSSKVSFSVSSSTPIREGHFIREDWKGDLGLCEKWINELVFRDLMEREGAQNEV